MKSVSIEYASQLIDFAPPGGAQSESLGRLQLEGTVAIHNMLVRNQCAYLADEVGMGKTYVALGVMGLFRYANPNARIMVLAPRENIQRKWIKERKNLISTNWRVEGNRVKSFQGTPTRDPIMVRSAVDLAEQYLLNDQSDVFARMTSFSIAVNDAKYRRRYRKQILNQIPWIDRSLLRSSNPEDFRDAFGIALNAAIPMIDLLVVDEAHSLKHGFGKRVATRNRVLAFAFGGVRPSAALEYYGHRVKNLLLLSATPFEYDYGDIARQFSVYGFDKRPIHECHGDKPRYMTELLNDEVSGESKRELVHRVLVRRTLPLTVAGKAHTKNMYRREWRHGGYESHDDEMSITSTKQRLIVGLMQKKVSEVLGDRRFNNHYQIGMLSSFESFLETVTKQRRPSWEEEPDEQDNSTFDGSQDATDQERKGVDSRLIVKIVKSYRRKFGQTLPHPKLDSTASHLATVFDTGEKALAFVRRIATVDELKEKLDRLFNEWIQRRMHEALPELKNELEELFDRYHEERKGKPQASLAEDERDEPHPDTRVTLEADKGGTDTFFAWFFRGAGPEGVLSGAAFQRNRLASDSSIYSTFFEDDHVSWLLGRPSDTIAELAKHLNRPPQSLREELRRRAFAFFTARTKRSKGYPRLYLFEAYQLAALQLLVERGGCLGKKATMVLQKRYDAKAKLMQDVPPGFPGPETGIGVLTFFTELCGHPELREAIWPAGESIDEFAEQFRKREQRRELISAMCRLGASFIDVYLIAISQIGSFDLRQPSNLEHPAQALAIEFVRLLLKQHKEQASSPSKQVFNAYYELSAAAKAFDTILAVNFSDVKQARLDDLAEMYGRVLQHQMPVAGISSGVSRRAVSQFRMPGFPLIMITTDVLQEGEDLHTFCANVIHYGITWTPSAVEQRTGRVDRIGSLTQRRLDGREDVPSSGEFLQVYYPHLSETVEVVQVKRVLERLNHFLKLIHQRPDECSSNSRINLNREILAQSDYPPQLKHYLKSDFEIDESWLQGGVHAPPPKGGDVQETTNHLNQLWGHLVQQLNIQDHCISEMHGHAGVMTIASPDGTRRLQPFDIELRSHSLSDAALLRCTSPIGLLDLSDEEVDQLYKLQKQHKFAKVCSHYDAKHHRFRLTIEQDILFHPESTQSNEVEHLVLRTAQSADAMERILFGTDADANEWLAQRENEDEH